MKYCKHCCSEIDKKAKVCPVCRREQKSFHIGRVLVATFLILILFFIIANYLSNNPINNNNSDYLFSDDNFSYEIKNSYADEYSVNYYIDGIVKNNSNNDYSYVQIEFICYDNQGNNLGTAIDNISNLGAHETWKFNAIALFTDIESISHCKYNSVTGW